MATISFTIPDLALPRLVDAYCALFAYPDTTWSGGVRVPNPETRAQFSRRMVLEEMQKRVRDFERATAHNAVPDPNAVPIT